MPNIFDATTAGIGGTAAWRSTYLSFSFMFPNLCAVLEPRGYRNGLDSSLREVEWMQVELDSAWVDAALLCPGRRGFIFNIDTIKTSPNRTLVNIHEVVCSCVAYRRSQRI